MKKFLTLISLFGAAAPVPDHYSVLDYDAKADGKTDNTVASINSNCKQADHHSP